MTSSASRTCVVFDIETDCTVNSAFGDDVRTKLTHTEATVVCAFELNADLINAGEDMDSILSSATYIVCWRDVDHGPGPFEALFKAMDRASILTCYNGIEFDMPVLRKYYKRSLNGESRYLKHMLKFHDPFTRIREVTGQWPSLNSLLASNGLGSKSSNGLEAIKMWEEGRRDELEKYCKRDVEALSQLILFGNGQHGVCMPVRTVPQRKGVTLTLPPRLTSIRLVLSTTR